MSGGLVRWVEKRPRVIGPERQLFQAEGSISAKQRSLQAWHFLRVTLGLVLIAAAVLKAHRLLTEPLVTVGLFTSPWFLVGVVEFELLVGLWHRWKPAVCNARSRDLDRQAISIVETH